MGTPKLKARAERNYRRGPTHNDCSGCDHFVRNFISSPKGDRCRLIGLAMGRAYSILPHYICDDHDDTKLMDMIHREYFGEENQKVRSCRVCGCTDNNCFGCIERTGEPCHWVDENLCSACAV